MYKSQIDPQDMFGAIYRFADQIQEAIEIGEKAGIPVHISHFKIKGFHNRGKLKKSLNISRFTA